MFYQICKILLWLPLNLIHPTTIKNRKNLPKNKVIICCNHRSNWDYVLFGLNTTRKNKVLAKKELFKNKFLGAILRNFGGIEIDRDGNDVGAIKECMKAIKDEKRLFVFPEGTRVHDDSQPMGKVKSGIAMIAIKTKTPIVPIWIEKAPKLFRRSRYFIGKPFELSEFYGKKLDEETLHEASEFVRNKMLEVRDENIKKRG